MAARPRRVRARAASSGGDSASSSAPRAQARSIVDAGRVETSRRGVAARRRSRPGARSAHRRAVYAAGEAAAPRRRVRRARPAAASPRRRATRRAPRRRPGGDEFRGLLGHGARPTRPRSRPAHASCVARARGSCTRPRSRRTSARAKRARRHQDRSRPRAPARSTPVRAPRPVFPRQSWRAEPSSRELDEPTRSRSKDVRRTRYHATGRHPRVEVVS